MADSSRSITIKLNLQAGDTSQVAKAFADVAKAAPTKISLQPLAQQAALPSLAVAARTRPEAPPALHTPLESMMHTVAPPRVESKDCCAELKDLFRTAGLNRNESPSQRIRLSNDETPIAPSGFAAMGQMGKEALQQTEGHSAIAAGFQAAAKQNDEEKQALTDAITQGAAQGFEALSAMGKEALAKIAGENAMAAGFAEAVKQAKELEDSLAPVLEEVFTLKSVWQELADEIKATEQGTLKITEALDPQLVKMRALAELEQESAQAKLKAAVQAAKEDMAPTVKAAPPTGLKGLFAKVGGMGEEQPAAVRIGAAKVAGIGYLGSQVGQKIGGPVGSAVSDVGNAVSTGAAGFAAGGPAGAAMALIPMAVDKVKELASAPFKLVGQGFDTLTSGMRELSGPLGAGGALLGGMQSLAEKVPLVGEALGGMVGSFKGFLDAGVGLSKLFSPGTSDRFEMVQKDTLATIGRAFTPIVEALTDLTKLAGDFLATVLPGAGEMREALSPLKEVFAELRSGLAEIAPLFKDFVRGNLVLLKIGLQALADTLKGLRFIFKEFTGVDLGKNAALKDSSNTAARGISFSNAETAAFEVYKAAFRGSQGESEGPKPEIQTASYLQKIHELLSAWYGKIKFGTDVAGAVKEDIQRQGPVGWWLDGAQKAAREMINMAR